MVGTMYKQVSPFEATKVGAALVGPQHSALHLETPSRTGRATGGRWFIAGAAANARARSLTVQYDRLAGASAWTAATRPYLGGQL